MSQQGYIGRNPGDGRTIVNRQTSHVTTGLQTSFTMTAGYEIGYLDVYLNGIKQTETLDYTASDGSTINFSLSFPPVNGDVLEFVAFETLNITNIKSARRNFTVGQDLDVSGNVTIGSSLTVASDLVVNGTFTTINTEILDVEDKTVGIASTSSPSNTTADGAGIVIYGGSDGDKSITWNTEKSNFVIVGGGVSIGTGVTISTPADNVLAFSVNSAEKARFNNFGAFTVGYEGEAWHESTYVGVLQAGSGAWIGQTPGASARAEWVNNAYYDSVNTRWEYIAADEANRIVLENGELKVQSADAGSADGAITWNEKLKMTVGGDFKIGAPTGIGVTISSSGNIDAIGIVTASSFVGNGANLTSLNASNIGSGTVPTARLGSGTASSSTFLRGDSTFQTVNTDLVSDTSPQLGGNLDTNSFEILLDDSHAVKFGDSNELEIFHASNGVSKIEDSGAGFHIRQINNGDIHIHAGADTGSSNNRLVARAAGAAELYHSGSKKLETGSSGIVVTGQMYSNSAQIVGAAGGDAELKLFSDSGSQAADKVRIRQTHVGNSFIIDSFANGSSYQSILKGTDARAIELHYQGSKKFETFASGVKWTGQLQCPTAGDTLQFTGANSNAFLLGMTSGADLPTGNDEHLQFHHWNGSAWEKTLFIQRHNMTIPDSNKIQFGDSADLQLYHNGTTNYCDIANGQQLYFRHNGSNKFYIQSGGAQFVGALYGDDNNQIQLGDSQDLKLYHNGTNAYIDADTSGSLYLRSNVNNQHIFLKKAGGGDVRILDSSNNEHIIFEDGGALRFLQSQTRSSNGTNSIMCNNNNALDFNGSEYMYFRINGNERARFQPSNNGYFQIGRSGNTPANAHMGIAVQNTICAIQTISDGTSGHEHIRFNNANGEVGRITTSGSSTSFQTSSDYRLKENDVAISDGVARVKKLRPIKFNWKSNPSETVEGFFAHEVQAIVPEAVDGSKDQVVTQADIDGGKYKQDQLGDPLYQAYDASYMVPVLTAAIKELITRVENLESA